MSVRVASLCTWAKPGNDSPPSLQLAALWGHLPRALGGRGLDLGAFSLLRSADSCSPWVPPSTREGERSQTPCIPELRREGPVRLGEVTISASREGRSPGPDLATAPPHHWATHGIGLELWLGRNQCYGNSSWLGWQCSCPEADSGWVGGLVWESSPAPRGRWNPPPGSTAWPVAAGQAVGRGRCRPTGVSCECQVTLLCPEVCL